MERLSFELLTDHILPFVGTDQFRYVAGINRTFHTAYTKIFQSKKTSVKTIECAKLYLKEHSIGKSRNLYFYSKDRAKNLILSLAALHGDMGIVRLFNIMHSDIKLKDTEITARAALNGNLAALKKLRLNGCPWDGYTCSNAALNGHLQVLVYAHKNRCFWNGYTCSNAASNGHLDVLQYARQHGCPWTAHTMKMAQDNGHVHITNWARANGCPEWKSRCQNFDFDDYVLYSDNEDDQYWYNHDDDDQWWDDHSF